MKIFALIFLTCFSFCINADNKDLIGVFSSLHISPTSGDLVRAEIHVLPHPAVVVQGSEGSAGQPELFKVTISGNVLTFRITENSATGLPPGMYTATIKKDKMILVGLGYRKELPRKKSFWQ